MIPEPSPMTKPLRRLSNGSEAALGSSTVVRALLLAKPAMAIGQRAASAPPVIMASARPSRIMRYASPMEWVPVAQAVTTGRFGPSAWKRMATLPDAILAIISGMKSGDTPRAPFSSSELCSLQKVWIPPTPEPMAQPRRLASTSLPTSRPLSRMACVAAASA